MSISEKNAKAIALLDKWLADKPGYDERVWPTIRRFLDAKHPPLVHGGSQTTWIAVVVVAAILGVGLIALFHLVFPSSIEVSGAVGCAGGLVLWGLP